MCALAHTRTLQPSKMAGCFHANHPRADAPPAAGTRRAAGLRKDRVLSKQQEREREGEIKKERERGGGALRMSLTLRVILQNG